MGYGAGKSLAVSSCFLRPAFLFVHFWWGSWVVTPTWNAKLIEPISMKQGLMHSNAVVAPVAARSDQPPIWSQQALQTG